MNTAKQRPLSKKQLEFIKGVTQGKPGYKAALDAYDTDKPEVANTIATENMQKPSIRAAIEAEFKRQGITLDTVLAPVVKGLRHKKKTEDGEVDDLDMQLRAHDRAVKLLMPREISGEGGITTNFNFFNVQSDEKNEFGL